MTANADALDMLLFAFVLMSMAIPFFIMWFLIKDGD